MNPRQQGCRRRICKGGSRLGLLIEIAALGGLLLLAGASSQLNAQPGSDPSELAPTEVSARANITVTPKRLTFEPGERTATVYIFNQGTVPASFDITLIDRVMLPNGEIEPVSETQNKPQLAPLVGRLKSGKDLLVATPRRATLAPGRGQMIRVRIKAPPPERAEYRSHLTVTTIPPRDIGLTAEEAAAAATGDRLSFQIASVFGISVPVIIRVGPPNVQGRISQVRFGYQESATAEGSTRVPVLSFQLERTGANSLYGNIEVTGSKSRTPYAVARGVGVYTEISSRSIQLPLQRPPSPNEKLEIRFIDDDITPGRVIAESSFIVG